MSPAVRKPHQPSLPLPGRPVDVLPEARVVPTQEEVGELRDVFRAIAERGHLHQLVALASGASPQEAAVLANFAAAIEVGKPGVATVSPDEVRESLSRHLAEAPV